MFFFLPTPPARWNLAGDPFQLRASHPDIFASAYPEGHPPVPSKVDYASLQLIRAKLPARRTHQSLALPIKVNRSAHALTDAATCDLPGFQLLQPRPPPNALHMDQPPEMPTTRDAPLGRQPPEMRRPDVPPEMRGPPASQEMLALEDAPRTKDADMQARPEVKNITTRMSHVTQSLFGTGPSRRRCKKKGGKKRGDGSDSSDGDDSSDGSETSAAPPHKSRRTQATRAMKAAPTKALKKPCHTKAMKTAPTKAMKTAPTNAMKTAPPQLVLAFPGVPKRPVLPMEYKQWRIYSDVNQEMWRCKRVGERKDKSCSWRSNPQAAWEKVNAIITGKAP